MTQQATQSLDNFRGDNLCVNMSSFGVKPDLVFASDGVLVSGSATFTTGNTSFTSADVGKLFWGENLSGSSDLLTKIVAINGPHSIQLGQAPSFSISGGNYRYGTDNTLGIQAAFAVALVSGEKIKFARGAYGITASLTPYSCLYICGHGYTQNNNPQIAATQIVCCANVPCISYAGSPFPTQFLDSFQCEKLTFVGTSRTGSKGIYINASYGTVIRDVSFNYFGNHGLQMISGESGRLENIQAQTCWLQISGRVSYVGCVDIGQVSDLILDQVIATSNESYSGASFATGNYNSGFIAGIRIAGGNAHVENCQGHGSEVGFVIDSTSASLTTFVNCRADQNQGEGWIISANNCMFIGCRSHSNSFASPGGYDGFKVLGSGNLFLSCQVTNQGGEAPLNNQVLNGFHDLGGGESNYYRQNYVQPGLWANQDYLQSGANQANPILDMTSFTLRLRNAAYGLYNPTGATNAKNWITRLEGSNLAFTSASDDLTSSLIDWLLVGRGVGTALSFILLQNAAFLEVAMPLLLNNPDLFINDPGEGVDQKRWAIRSNTGSHQLVISAQNDSVSVENVAISIQRAAGASLAYIQFLAPYMEFLGNINIGATSGVSNRIVFESNTGIIITAGSGTPNGHVTASPGAAYLDANGNIWVKSTGSNTNTGWSNITASISSIIPSSLTAHGVVVGEGSSTVNATSAGASGAPFIGQGVLNDPKFGGVGDAINFTGMLVTPPNGATGALSGLVNVATTPKLTLSNGWIVSATS